MKNRFICAEEVAQELSVSKPYAYKLRTGRHLCKMWGLPYPQSYLAGGRRTEICWSMGTKTFAVFEGVPQDCISGSADEWQIEQLSGRYRGTGTGTL